MKEYASKLGGRYVFNEDLQNLQELALSMANLFKDSGLNFVISGCKVTKTSSKVIISGGYVFIDNKVRVVAQQEYAISRFNSGKYIRIYSWSADGPQVVYANGSSYKQYVEYKTKVTVSQSLSDGSSYIEYSEDGSGNVTPFPDLRTAWFRHYCPTVEPSVDWADFDIDGKFPDTADGSTSRQDVANSFGQSVVANGGMTVNGLPVFSLSDVMAIRRGVMKKLAVNDYAWLYNARIENLKIGNRTLEQYIGGVGSIEHVRLIAKMRNDSSTGSEISTLKAIVTDYRLIVTGAVTRAQLDGAAEVTDVIQDLNLYLPESVKSLLTLSYDVTAQNVEADSVTDASDTFAFYRAPYRLGNIYYIRGSQAASGDGSTPYSPGVVQTFYPEIIILKSGKLKFGSLPGAGNHQYPHTNSSGKIEFAVTFDRVPSVVPDDYSE